MYSWPLMDVPRRLHQAAGLTYGRDAKRTIGRRQSRMLESVSMDRTSTLKLSMLDLFQNAGLIVASPDDDIMRELMLGQKDRSDAVAAHTQKGIDFLERIGVFAKERAAIEDEYAAKLRSLAKKTLGKKKEDEEAIKSFTCVRSFSHMLRELESVAAQHELIGENLRNEVMPFVGAKSNAHKSARKDCLNHLQMLHNNLNDALERMYKAQRNYGKSFKEAEAAFGKYCKAEKNMEISRLDLEKAKTNSQSRSRMNDEAKQTYAYNLQQANDLQSAHFEHLMPEALDKLRAVDFERIKDTQTAMEMCISSETNVNSVIARCHDDMRRVVSDINANYDTAVVVEQFKTGYPRPAQHQFEDLGRPDSVPNGNHEVDSTLKRGMLGGKKDKTISRKQSMHQKFFGGSDKKAEANGDYGALPPQQKIRKLQAKIGELEKERDKTQQSRDGLIKMQQVYRDNPKLGNPTDCDGQLTQYGREMEALTSQIQKFRFLLEETHQLTTNLSISGADTPPSARSGSSASSAPPTRPAMPGQRASMSEESIASSDGGRNGSAHRDEVYDECSMPAALGTASVQFAYDGGTEGTMKIVDGEELLLIERDEGDGWTRVRKMDGPLEGFVPTSYLRCTWYADK